MSSSHGYILVLDTESRSPRGDYALPDQLQYPMVIASSVEQAINHALRIPPSLVILIGDNVHNWSASLVSRLRQNTQAQNLTIVALTNSASPQWTHMEETLGLDGFFVKPLSTEILNLLVDSALVRQCQA
jgi:DNA-binding response OmpR family regulator